MKHALVAASGLIMISKTIRAGDFTVNKIILGFSMLLIPLPFLGQAASYTYQGRTIILTPDPTVVAAVVHPNVGLASKYPNINSMFNILASSTIRTDSFTVVSKASVPLSAASQSLSPAIQTKEVAPVPVYRLGDLKLVLQNELIVAFKPTTSMADAQALLSKFSSLFVEINPQTGKYLVRLGNPEATLRISSVLQGNKSISYSEPNFVVIQSEVSNKHFWSPPHSVNRLANPLDAARGSGFPSDPMFDQQWALYNEPSTPNSGKAGVDIRALKAWAITKGSPNIKIAVLDEGVDDKHPDLAANVAMNAGIPIQYDAILDSAIQQPASVDSHGTRVAGIIAAASNDIGIIGVAPQATLIPIRVGSTSDSPGGAWTTPVIAAEGLQKAIDLGADVVNISWELSPSSLVKDAIADVLTQGRKGLGAVVVCAAGNDGGPVIFPANLSTQLPLIAVGAINSWGEVKTKTSKDGEDWWASNVGPEVSVVAPGVGIVTTDLGSALNAPASGLYVTTFNGTSSSAPIVSGIAGLILSVNGNLKPSDVRDIIQTTASIAAQGRTDEAGWGLVNACAAVSSAAKVAPSCDQ